jgi:hypothetical protein
MLLSSAGLGPNVATALPSVHVPGLQRSGGVAQMHCESLQGLVQLYTGLLCL